MLQRRLELAQGRVDRGYRGVEPKAQQLQKPGAAFRPLGQLKRSPHKLHARAVVLTRI